MKALAVMLALACAGAAAQSPVEVRNAVEAHLSSRNLFTGEELYRQGEGPVFHAYVTGVFDAGSMTGPPLRMYCLPAGVTDRQIADVALKYLRENPAHRHLGAAHLVRRAFRDAWPCPAGAPPEVARRGPSL